MNAAHARTKALLTRILGEIALPSGEARTEAFADLRAVDAKVREVKLALAEADLSTLLAALESDGDFQANSRRVRLEALGHLCRTALRFIDAGAASPGKPLLPAPSMAKLTNAMPNLEPVIQARWIEAQRCQHAGAFLASVILMGSILEALLLGRCLLEAGMAYQMRAAPRDRVTGRNIAINDWMLSSLIDVCVEAKWLNIDRGAFSHALRQSRNLVHPYEQARSAAAFDDATCKVCWQVLNASVEDLLA